MVVGSAFVGAKRDPRDVLAALAIMTRQVLRAYFTGALKCINYTYHSPRAARIHHKIIQLLNYARGPGQWTGAGGLVGHRAAHAQHDCVIARKQCAWTANDVHLLCVQTRPTTTSTRPLPQRYPSSHQTLYAHAHTRFGPRSGAPCKYSRLTGVHN